MPRLVWTAIVLIALGLFFFIAGGGHDNFARIETVPAVKIGTGLITFGIFLALIVISRALAPPTLR